MTERAEEKLHEIPFDYILWKHYARGDHNDEPKTHPQ